MFEQFLNGFIIQYHISHMVSLIDQTMDVKTIQDTYIRIASFTTFKVGIIIDIGHWNSAAMCPHVSC